MSVKICTVCKEEKGIDCFYFKDKLTGKLHAQCKSCYAEKRKLSKVQHYLKYREAYRERARLRKVRIKSLRQKQLYDFLEDKFCKICGNNDIRVLEFDHINPESKKFGIARAVNDGYAWELILEEVKKCRILCANCHRIRTAEQFGWRKSKELVRWPRS